MPGHNESYSSQKTSRSILVEGRVCTPAEGPETNEPGEGTKQDNWPERREKPGNCPYKEYKLPKGVVLSLSSPVGRSVCSFQ